MSAACERIVLATSVSTVTIESTSTFTPVAGEMVGDIRPGHFVALCRLAGHGQDFDRLGAHQQRHGIGHGARRTPAAVPGYEDAIERQALSLNIRNDEHGPAGVEERRLDEEPLERGRVRLRLTHDRQIEPPRDLGENVGGAHDGDLEHVGFGRNGGASRGFIERGHGGLRPLFVFGALRIHHFGGETIPVGQRHERLITECDSRNVRIERSGNRNRKLGRNVAGDAHR
jgi:hypothetical protein